MSGCGVLFSILEVVFTRLSDVFHLMKAVKRSRNIVFKISAGYFVNVLSEVLTVVSLLGRERTRKHRHTLRMQKNLD